MTSTGKTRDPFSAPGAVTGDTGLFEFTPAPPLKTSARLAGVVVMAIAMVFVATAAWAAVAATEVEWVKWMFTAAAVLGLASVVLPGVRAFGEHRTMRRSWQAGEYTASRRASANSRTLSLKAIGLGGFSLVVVTLVLFITVNNGAVRETFFDFGIIVQSFQRVLMAFGINVLIAVAAEALSLLFGLGLALIRQMKGPGTGPLRALAITYIDIFRGLPGIIVIYLVCFGLPLTGIPVISEQSLLTYAIIALTLTYSAYCAEQFRSGIEAVHRSQMAAALSLGLSSGAATRKVVLPQVARTIAAPMLSNFIGLQKDTALVYVVGIMEAFTQAKTFSVTYYNLSSVTVVCLLFILITIPQTRLVDYILAKQDRKARG
ncbi:amino acid ABC transporter permease [Leucobacter sp. wl10]|uniref:amino acid ABC transporter permease n=1 Tax=Leucobacter sp. wl10 TaxID=2304677 RepID=UPI000E5A6371|nr:amino acid ABC transporter permease [Leucobacter sp. wl10]RGE20095.1 ABC transporter permease subunit [Leucobacter sp. wl10]